MYRTLRSTILWFIPAIAYLFNLSKIWFLVKSDKYVEFRGFTLNITDPNSGGSNSYPPITDTDSASGKTLCTIAS